MGSKKTSCAQYTSMKRKEVRSKDLSQKRRVCRDVKITKKKAGSRQSERSGGPKYVENLERMNYLWTMEIKKRRRGRKCV